MTVRTRLTAAERGEQLIAAAVTAFASGGYAGTTTDQVARLAGVTQPYVIRLFGSKQRLFIAVMDHVCDRIEATFRQAAGQAAGQGADTPDVATLGGAYIELLAERDLLAVLLHGFGASADPEIGDVVRAGFGRIYETVRELTGGSVEELHAFMAEGMLCTVLSAMRLAGPDAVPSPPWAADLMAGFGHHTDAPQ